MSVLGPWWLGILWVCPGAQEIAEGQFGYKWAEAKRPGLWHKFAKGLVPGVRISRLLLPGGQWERGKEARSQE